MQTAGVRPTTAGPVFASDRGLQSLSSEDFFRILVTEMRQQDPLEPTKTADMISSVAQIRNIELSGQLTASLGQLAGQQRGSGASQLLGKFVTAQTTDTEGVPTAISGLVTGVRFDPDGAVLLELDNGQVVRAVDVTHITTLEEFERFGTGTPSPALPPATDPPAAQGPNPPPEAPADAAPSATARRRDEPAPLLNWSLDGMFRM